MQGCLCDLWKKIEEGNFYICLLIRRILEEKAMLNEFYYILSSQMNMIFISLLIQYICRLIVITQEELKKQGFIRRTLISFYFNPSVIPNKMGGFSI